MSFWDDGGIPVIGSSFVFKWAIVHEGVMRRSEEEAVEMTKRGMSRLVVRVWAMWHAWENLGVFGCFWETMIELYPKERWFPEDLSELPVMKIVVQPNTRIDLFPDSPRRVSLLLVLHHCVPVSPSEYSVYLLMRCCESNFRV